MKFVDVKNDVAFRKIFGNENKTFVLISFLNAILKFKEGEQIKEVAILNPYKLPRIAGEKASIIDVRATDETGRKFVIEMQVSDIDGFDKRVQYYTSREYSTQIDTGNDYKLLHPAYFVGVLNFDFFESPHYLSHHIIVDGKTYEHKLKDIQFTFIELEKFDLKLHQLRTLEEKWIFFIKNAKNLDVIPEDVDDKGLVEAYHDAYKHNWTREELTNYDNAAIAMQDAVGKLTRALNKGMEEGIKKGKQEGIEEGIKKGKQEGLLETAKKMKAKGYAIAEISDILGLPIEELEQL